MTEVQFGIKGLTTEQVLASRQKNGINTLQYKRENPVLEALKNILKEPMILLLLVTSIIYFLSNEFSDGLFLACAIVLVAGISLYQDSRSRNALEKLKDLTQPKCKVIRDGAVLSVKAEELVVDDCMILEEGAFVSADGVIIQSNDFSVNESVLTGESLSVFKDATKQDNMVYKGTIADGGLAVVRVVAIGQSTKLGKIGSSMESIQEEKTPLEIKINDFVKKMVLAGAIVFVAIWVINYLHSHNVLSSLLKALTLAMSILPEEIPVAFTTFMAIGAWRLMNIGIVVKQMKTVETLGSATVICVDKTGTITENKMSLAMIYLLKEDKLIETDSIATEAEKELIRQAMWASEPVPFDAMEVALHNAYKSNFQNDERPLFKMAHEYPLSGKPLMMTHVFEDNKGNRIIAAKGAPEAIVKVSGLNKEETEKISAAVATLGDKGYRVLGVSVADFIGSEFPATQQEIQFHFTGLVAFYDPPKQNMAEVLQSFYNAGIKVKIITGDNPKTTSSIAKQVGLVGAENLMSGDELMTLSENDLSEKVNEKSVFTRMFPEAKLRIVNALKARGEIVAMTGDGVNDGPALKAAHIGIAMGKRGSEIAKDAASLILAEDDLSKMIDAISAGRKIYTNLKKAIQYIISIHIPIIAAVALPLILGWKYPNIFTPVHVIFLELIMGPTCSIIYENEPMEANTMLQKPRPFSSTFFNASELLISTIQGLFITVGALSVYQLSVMEGNSEDVTRAMIFVTLISANIFLTLVNRSFYYSVITTLGYKNNLVPIMIGATILLTGLALLIPPVSRFFSFGNLNAQQFLICAGVGFVSVLWFELVKWRKRKQKGTVD